MKPKNVVFVRVGAYWDANKNYDEEMNARNSDWILYTFSNTFKRLFCNNDRRARFP